MIAVLRIEQHENASREGVDRNTQNPRVLRKILLDLLFQRLRAIQTLYFITGPSFYRRMNGLDHGLFPPP